MFPPQRTLAVVTAILLVMGMFVLAALPVLPWDRQEASLFLRAGDTLVTSEIPEWMDLEAYVASVFDATWEAYGDSDAPAYVGKFELTNLEAGAIRADGVIRTEGALRRDRGLSCYVFSATDAGRVLRDTCSRWERETERNRIREQVGGGDDIPAAKMGRSADGQAGARRGSGLPGGPL